MQQEIQSVQVGELEPLHVALADTVEVALHALDGELFEEHVVVVRLERDDPDIRRVTFVPGTGVGQVQQG
jgi:hypothetical protein